MTTVPCETCGRPTPYTNQCDRCRAVERLLPDYLKSPGGRRFVHQLMPLLDDWTNGKPGWDYEAVLSDNSVVVEWWDTLFDGEGNKTPAGEFTGWGLSWKQGSIHIGQTTETIARKAAAMFVSLWLRGVSASFADKLMAGFIWFLELQEAAPLTFVAEVDQYSTGEKFFRLTRENFCRRESFEFDAERKIIKVLDPQPDEEVIVTFTKRKRQP